MSVSALRKMILRLPWPALRCRPMKVRVRNVFLRYRKMKLRQRIMKWRARKPTRTSPPVALRMRKVILR